MNTSHDKLCAQIVINCFVTIFLHYCKSFNNFKYSVLIISYIGLKYLNFITYA